MMASRIFLALGLALAMASAIASSTRDGSTTLVLATSSSTRVTDDTLTTLRHSVDDIPGTFQGDTGQAASGLGADGLAKRQDGKAVIPVFARQNFR